jgi:hypothetical protein
MLAAEWVFHARLRAEGERVYLDPAAVTRHTNFAAPGVFASVTFRAARSSAAARADGWPRARRLAYGMGAPLIPVVRLRRTLGALSPGARRAVPLARTLPVFLAGLAIDAAGQAAGFLRGRAGGPGDVMLDLELERLRFVTAEDRASLP